MLSREEKAYNDVVNKIFIDELSEERIYSIREIRHMLNYDLAYQDRNPEMLKLVEYTRANIDSVIRDKLKKKINRKYYNQTNNMAKEIKRDFNTINRRYREDES